MGRFLQASAFALLSLAHVGLTQECGDCQSYGIDFLNGGSYFQNSDSTDPFTALQEFDGCSNDTSNNIFVDPNGDQYECSMSQLQPDDTPQLVTCPLNKNDLFDGDWSLLILSNNGQCDPIDYQRDFSLSVGPQETILVSPTVYLSTTTTPIESTIQTETQTITQTANPSTATVPRATLSPTITKYPLPKITLLAKAILTVTKTKQIPNVVSTFFTTTTPKCKPTAKRRVADPIARIAATILGDLGLKGRDALPAPTARSGTMEFKRAILEGRAVAPAVKAKFLQERKERLVLNKRAPDQPVVTSTDSDGEPFTSTITSTAPTKTLTGTTTIPSTTTTTPTITVSKGVVVDIKTVTAPRETITLTLWKPATTIRVTRTMDLVMTVTETSTPAGASASCAKKGGVLT